MFEYIWYNVGAATIAFFSDFCSQTVFEDRLLMLPKNAKALPQTARHKRAVTEDGQHIELYDMRRGLRFSLLNMAIMVPTVMWLDWMRGTVFPDSPLKVCLLTWTTWTPMMYSFATLYAATQQREDAYYDWKMVKKYFKANYFTYLPVIYVYAVPMFIMFSYVIPVAYVPLFAAGVDFLSDIFGSWFVHRHKNRATHDQKVARRRHKTELDMQQQQKLQELQEKADGHATAYTASGTMLA
eukprot:TRINITY_DN2987_c0_g1_i1.p2 TRINITY_DN2987_c0_g1~~TRINITY_DN2987_c0_g1_i1.p2  ORF type:complete len:240 (+),score=66.49 TRINITY_DN2987_c0_g1_i1:50-769(+)